MRPRRTLDRARARALFFSGFQLVFALSQTVVLAAEDLWIQLVTQVVTHAGGVIARRLIARRQRRVAGKQMTDAIEPR